MLYIYNILCNACSALKRRGLYLKTLFPHGFCLEYTWSVCWKLAGNNFSSDAF